MVEEVNKELVKEVNDGLVLVCRCGDGRRGDHKVDGGHRDDVEVNQEVDKEVATVVDELVVEKFWLFLEKVLTNADVVQNISHVGRV